MKEKIDQKLFELGLEGRKAKRIALTEKGLQELLDDQWPMWEIGGRKIRSTPNSLKCPHCGKINMTYAGIPVYILEDEDVSIE